MAASNALIIGASRGLGLGLVREYLARGWTVTGTVRGSKPTELHAFAKQAGGLTLETIDIDDPAAVKALRGRLEGQSFDVLFVNAGVSNGPTETVADIATEEFVRVMVTNALSPLRVAEALQDLVPAGGLVAMMSSGLGSVANNDRGGWEVYRASKASLNTLMRSFAVRHAGGKRSYAVIAPGWVRTDMGGPGADLDVETSIRGVVDTLEKQKGKPGLQYLNYLGQTLPW